MVTVKPRLLKGMQDGWPELASARRRMIAQIESVCQQFGFLPFDSPAMEALDALLGPEPTPEQLMGVFHFVNHDDEAVGLRYDLTVPLARIVSLYRQDLPQPFRRYQLGSVFRFDKPEPGRFREFLQFDVDTVGTASMAADAEIIAVIDRVLRALSVANYKIRLSNRKLLTGLGTFAGASVEQARSIYRVVDKLEKYGRERVRQELGPGLIDASGDRIAGLGLSERQIARIEEFLDLPNEGDSLESLQAARALLKGNALAEEGLKEVEEILQHLAAFGVPRASYMLDLHLARWIAYYTGPVFEVTLADLPSYGSVFGGGRYDGLVERFMGEGQGVPAVGASVGVDRLLAALAELGQAGSGRAGAQVLVTVMDAGRMVEYIALARELREAGIAAEVYLGSGGLSKQVKYADRLGIPLAVIIGEDELKRGEATVKDMELGRRIAAEVGSREEWKEQKQQFTVPRGELLRAIRERLGMTGG